MSSPLRTIALGGGAGLITYLYNWAAQKEKLGQSAPYITPPAAAAIGVMIPTLFARTVSKNPFVAIGVGGLSFVGLCAYGDYNNTLSKREWALYDKNGVIPSQKVLQMALEHSDSPHRKTQARDLLGALSSRVYTERH